MCPSTCKMRPSTCQNDVCPWACQKTTQLRRSTCLRRSEVVGVAYRPVRCGGARGGGKTDRRDRRERRLGEFYCGRLQHFRWFRVGGRNPFHSDHAHLAPKIGRCGAPWTSSSKTYSGGWCGSPGDQNNVRGSLRAAEINQPRSTKWEASTK